ncbi:MAG: DUF4249 domain-containing protein [Spirosomataceae bacterium]
MKQKFTTLLQLLLSIALMQACVEPYDFAMPITQKILIVDGSITDQPKDQFVIIKIADPKFNTTSGVKDATVEVIEDNKTVIGLTDRNKDGTYFFPTSFQAKYNVSYKLRIKTKEGTQYESSSEVMVQGPKIDKVYTEFLKDGIPSGNSFSPAHFVYIDTKDPAGVKNNYFWTYRFWERQGYCVTCSAGRYFYNSRTRSWECRDEQLEFDYDYVCDRDCWDIFYNTDLNVLTDTYTDGKAIIGRTVAKIPYYQRGGALVEITQQSVSQTAFRYLRLLIDQGQNTGTLADTPPAALIGNIKNVNDPNESVGGIFMVSSTQTHLFWLDRKDVPINSVNPIGLLGRPANPEVSSDPTRPPLAACIASRNRTPSKPRGWVD